MTSGAAAAFLVARTPSEYARARIALLLHGLPEEVLDTADPRRLPRAERDWLDGLRRDVRSGGREPARFPVRTSLARDATLLGVPDGPAPRLLVLFAGLGQRFTAPLAVVLQHLPRDRHDVLILRDPSGSGYARGVQGLGDDPDALAAALEVIAAGRPLVTLGASMGGWPAVDIGLRAGAERAVSLGGGPNDDRLPTPRAEAGPTRVLAVHAGGNAHDAARAERIVARTHGAVRVILEGDDRHAVLKIALEAGRLAELLALLVGPGAIPETTSGVFTFDVVGVDGRPHTGATTHRPVRRSSPVRRGTRAAVLMVLELAARPGGRWGRWVRGSVYRTLGWPIGTGRRVTPRQVARELPAE
jgi:hypothetical protein